MVTTWLANNVSQAYSSNKLKLEQTFDCNCDFGTFFAEFFFRTQVTTNFDWKTLETPKCSFQHFIEQMVNFPKRSDVYAVKRVAYGKHQKIILESDG